MNLLLFKQARGIKYEGGGPLGAFVIRKRSCFVLQATGIFREKSFPQKNEKHLVAFKLFLSC